MKTIAKFTSGVLLATLVRASLLLSPSVQAQGSSRDLAGIDIEQWIASQLTGGAVDAVLRVTSGDVSIMRDPSEEAGSVLSFSAGEVAQASLVLSLGDFQAIDALLIRAEIFFEGNGFFGITGAMDASTSDPRRVSFTLSFKEGTPPHRGLQRADESEARISGPAKGVSSGIWHPVTLKFYIKERRLESSIADSAPQEIAIAEDFEFLNFLQMGLTSGLGGKVYLRNLKIETMP